MVDELPERLTPLHEALVAADGDRSATFNPVVQGGMGPVAWTAASNVDLDQLDGHECQPEDLAELADRGYLDMAARANKRVARFAISDAGREAVARRRAFGQTSAAYSARWSDLRPILEAVLDLHEHASVADGPGIAARVGREVPMVNRQLDLLRREGHLTAVIDPDFGWDDVQPTEKTLQQVSGWPSEVGPATVDALLAAIDTQLADTEDPAQRTKLQHLRGSLKDVGTGTVTGLLVAALKAAAGA